MFLDSFIFVIHILVIIFGLFGFLLPKKYLILHLLMWPIVLIHWLKNNDKCIISQIEKSLIESDGGKKKFKSFSTRIFNLIGFDLDYNIREDRRQVKYMNMTIFTISWVISLVRYIYL